jgi:FAD/FMN-containing dehydrogenase
MTERSMKQDDIEKFRGGFSGETSTAADRDYDSLRSIWNGAIDRRPAVIARCTTARQVGDSIRFARQGGLEVAVRGGGHSYAGNSVCDGGMMIHLGAMNGVAVDAAARRVVCGGGATWADVDSACQQHGLATPGGFISHTGIAGLTLGGGIGWLTKMAGLSCDNLVAAQMVTADSRIVRASKSVNPELFWALCGGGGNFGVVTSFEFALHPVGPLVHLGLFFVGLDRGAEALRFARDYVKALPASATAFLAIGMSAPPAPFVPEQHRFRQGHALLVVGFGSAEEHQAVVAPIRDSLISLFELVTPIPFVALQQLFNESATWGSLAYEKALYLDELSDAAIAVIDEHVPKKTSPLSFCPTFTLSGAYLARADGDSAFGGRRSPGYVFNIEAATSEPAVFEADRTWVRNFWSAMRPHAAGSGGYVNFMVEADDDRVRASYGEDKYRRLALVKAEYDPANIFHLNANVKPAPKSA